MPDPTASRAPGGPTEPDAVTLATDLREALRPLWRRLSAHKTLSMGKTGILFHLEQRGPLTATDLAGLERLVLQAPSEIEGLAIFRNQLPGLLAVRGRADAHAGEVRSMISMIAREPD